MLEYYVLSLAAMVLCSAIAAWASGKVRSAYKKYGKMPTSSHMTGYDTAKRLLRAGGVYDVRVGKVAGHLSDHYHPKKKSSICPRAYTATIRFPLAPWLRTKSGTCCKRKRAMRPISFVKFSWVLQTSAARWHFPSFSWV